MKDQIVVSKNFKLLAYILIGIGVVSFALGFVFDAKRTWANYLLNNYYFLSIAMGAAFFWCNSVYHSIGLVGSV